MPSWRGCVLAPGAGHDIPTTNRHTTSTADYLVVAVLDREGELLVRGDAADASVLPAEGGHKARAVDAEGPAGRVDPDDLDAHAARPLVAVLDREAQLRLLRRLPAGLRGPRGGRDGGGRGRRDVLEALGVKPGVVDVHPARRAVARVGHDGDQDEAVVAGVDLAAVKQGERAAGREELRLVHRLGRRVGEGHVVDQDVG